MTPAIIFDLDGTLIDSVPDLAAALNLALSAQGHPVLDLPTITGFVGDGLPKLIERAMMHNGIDMALHSELTQSTLENYMRAPTERTALYPGIRNALEALRSDGYALGICTNKPQQAAHQVLRALDMQKYFDVVVGGDTAPERKPDPAPLRLALRGLSATRCIYVGDSEVDAETARRAQVPFLLFTEGYRKTPIAELPHDIAYSDSSQLPDLIRMVSAQAAQ